MNKKLQLMLLLSFLGIYVEAQVSPVKNMGNVQSVNVGTQQLKITTENAFAEVTVYTPSVIRFRMDKKPLQDDFSYAVIVQPQQTKTTITQTQNEITLTTDSIKLIISKNPFAIACFTADGKIISQDEIGLTTSWVQESVTTYKKMQDGERFIGLGEKTGNLDRKGSGYTHWNTDAFGYTTNQDPIYSTIPFYIGIHHGLNYGIFLDNTYQSDFNFGASNNRFSSFGARGGEMNYYFIHHKNISDIITSYTWLTGRMKMPPLWSLGYQQNRYSYYPEAEVFRIAETLREKKIPADGITLDIHYMDEYKLFTWNKSRFPEPRKMTDKLKQMGFKTTVIVDPGIKVEKGYGAYERGVKENIFLKYPDGTDYSGQVWPGWVHFPDFTSEQGRNWWKKEVNFFANDGVDGLWNDMNEIATWGQKMPDNVLFNYDGHQTSHLQGHNVYALGMVRASYEGARAISEKRPFILTRAGYSGLQRYSAIWTGDNRSEDSHMLLGVRLLNSLGLSGVSFTGMDVGGFTGNPSTALYAKWVQLGAFTPYFRNHTAINTKSSEPWAYGEEVLEIARNFINLRYRLLPYLYSSFYESVHTGMPVMRSLAINYTHDPKIYNPVYENQYLFGQSFLITPFESTEKFGRVYFPKGRWYNLYTGEVENGNQEKIIPLHLNKLPVFVKESSIIPEQSLIQSTIEKPTDTLTIHIYKGNIASSFIYYEDDGETYKYEQGNCYKRLISYNPDKKTITLAKSEGTYSSHFNQLKLVFHGFNDTSTIKVGGSAAKITTTFTSFINPVSRFDPQGFSNKQEGYDTKSIIIKNNSQDIRITY